MQIDVTISKRETINLSDMEAHNFVLRYINTYISPNYYLRTKKNGKVWLVQDDPEWRHGSVSEVDVREATEDDILLINMRSLIDRKKQNG